MEKKKFKEFCNSGRCSRGSIITPKCVKELKQERCFIKFIKKEAEKKEKLSDKIQKDVSFNEKVWFSIFDISKDAVDDWQNYCGIWKILSIDQKEHIKKKYGKELWLNNNLDIAHIKQRSSTPELKFDIDNVVIVGRYFHGLLDGFQNPVTQEKISGEDRLNWFLRAKFMQVESTMKRNKIGNAY